MRCCVVWPDAMAMEPGEWSVINLQSHKFHLRILVSVLFSNGRYRQTGIKMMTSSRGVYEYKKKDLILNKYN